jgi:ATP-binding cassette subfamily B protein
MQRIGDHNRIQNFLTSTALNILFGVFNIIVFSIVLAIYSWKILGVFLLGSAIYFFWILIFLRRRRALDSLRFAQLSENQGTLIQIITGMQEIKLNNCERQKRWKWEQLQARLFKTQMKSLNLSQYQQLGGLFFNETKNIIITFMSAFAVLSGEMTLGMMVALQYILGQMNGPINQMVNFVQSAQDARISLERLGEIHGKKNEGDTEGIRLNELPEKLDITVEKLDFQYEGPQSPMVLRNINLKLEAGKVTAIVGASGSGKTTLVKLLLGFYPPTQGGIRVGDHALEVFEPAMWRKHCGAVMQDGFIFSESIAHNIAPGEDIPDIQRLKYAASLANLDDFIGQLPLGYNTVIGMEGSGISQGQKQRILIARAVYKNPVFLLLDEATNALDATNERVIHDHLSGFFKGKTVVIVAHRLSTVRNADQIIVLEKGQIVESGNHEELATRRGAYYHLVKNQLELGA